MSAIIRPSGRTSLKYDAYNRLAEARLPNGALVQYEYGDELMPIKITLNGQSALEYKWSRFIHLEKCVDHMSGLSFYPEYRKGYFAPVSVSVRGYEETLQSLTGVYPLGDVKLTMGEDQVNSVRRFVPLGHDFVMKEIDYDSFGNVIRDTRPQLRFPLGFACGMNDP